MKQLKSYLIDMCQRGNAIRLYFGNSVEVITGDDWDDTPYEHNAGPIYSEFVNCYMDVLVPFHWRITDFAQELEYYENSKYCKNDFKHGDIPLFWCIDAHYERDNVSFFMGESKQVVMKKLDEIGTTLQIIKKEK